MSSVCISNCATDPRVPARATYVTLHKWPESDSEFVKTKGGSGGRGTGRHQHPRLEDGMSCKQVYLRSYTFSRKAETVPERTKKCLDRVRERVVAHGGGGGGRRRRRKKTVNGAHRRRCVVVVRRVKELSCAALCAIFHRLLSCTATVDVVDHIYIDHQQK